MAGLALAKTEIESLARSGSCGSSNTTHTSNHRPASCLRRGRFRDRQGPFSPYFSFQALSSLSTTQQARTSHSAVCLGLPSLGQQIQGTAREHKAALVLAQCVLHGNRYLLATVLLRDHHVDLAFATIL